MNKAISSHVPCLVVVVALSALIMCDVGPSANAVEVAAPFHRRLDASAQGSIAEVFLTAGKASRFELIQGHQGLEAIGQPFTDSDVIAQIDPKQAGNLLDGALNVIDQATQAVDRKGQQMLALSIEEERKWGKELHRQLLEEHQVAKQLAVSRRIAQLAALLLKRKQRDIDYTFTVLKSKEVDAFAMPGGYIYVSQALVEFVADDDELQFVLGHEIGHVDLQHCSQKLTYAARASEATAPVAGRMVGCLHNLLTRPYSQEQEFEADAYGLKAIWAVGKTTIPAVTFLRRFGQHLESEKGGSSVTDKESPFAWVAQRMENHFHTHPPIAERIAHLEALKRPPAAPK
jgi:Zn-dependent protease with chaperone function